MVMRGERVGVIGRTARARACSAKLLAGELEPTAGERWIGPSIELGTVAQGHDTLPSARHAAGRGPPGAARAPRAGGARCWRASSSPTSRCASPVAHAQRRRAHAAATAAADARRRQLPGAGRADEPPRHRLGRGAGGRARAVRRHGRRHLARPLLPRPHRATASSRWRDGTADRLRGRLQRPGTPATARRGRPDARTAAAAGRLLARSADCWRARRRGSARAASGGWALVGRAASSSWWSAATCCCRAAAAPEAGRAPAGAGDHGRTAAPAAARRPRGAARLPRRRAVRRAADDAQLGELGIGTPDEAGAEAAAPGAPLRRRRDGR